jgi:5'-deoxynucleotidase YfbR-like HD superfamily hydrolase
MRRYCGDHTNTDAFKMLFNTASKEKEDFVCLNDRLADLFAKLEKMRSENGKDGCAQYMKTILCLHEEIKKLRAHYEAELSKLR